MARADLLTLIGDLVPAADLGRLPDGAAGRALDAAVLRYGVDRPREIASEVAGGEGGAFAVDTGMVAAETVEHPLDRVPATLLDGRRWRAKESPAGLYILLADPLPRGAVIRVTGRGRHVCDGATDTIPDPHRLAVASLAAAQLLDALAAATAGDTDSSIAADSADHRGASDRYASRAKVARKVYDDTLAASGPEPGRPAAACATVALASSPRLFGRRW